MQYNSNKEPLNQEQQEKILKNIALRYLARYSTSSAALKNYLLKKITKIYSEEIKENNNFLDQWDNALNQVVQYMEYLGYINDTTYTKQKVRKLINSGKSKFYIHYKLKEKGISTNHVESIFNIESSSNLEILSAINFIKKKRLGPYSKNTNDPKQYSQKEKEYAKMYQNGFSIDTIKMLLSLSVEDLEKLQESYINTLDEI